MKTAIQEAIDYLRKYNLLSAAVILEDKFLDKEKIQIVTAYTKGQLDIVGVLSEECLVRGINAVKVPVNDTEDGEEYYSETFGG